MSSRNAVTLAAIFGLPLGMYLIAVVVNVSLPCGPDYAQALIRRSLVQVAAGRSSDSIVPAGTGFAVSDDGHILTSRSVLLDPATDSPSPQIVAKLPDGLVVRARYLASDERLDLAMLKVDGAEELRPVKWSESTVWVVGQPLVAAGFEQTGDGRFAAAPKFTRVDLGSHRSLDGASYLEHGAVGPGLNGGPLVTMCGEVVGIVTRGAGADTPSGTSFSLDKTAAEAKVREWLEQ